MRTRLTSRLSLLFMSFALMLALPAMAFADQVANNLDSSVDTQLEVMALDEGGLAKSTTIYVNPADGDGKGGCNLKKDDSISVSVSSSNIDVATVSPSSVTLGGCNLENGKPITVTPVKAGTATITLNGPTSIDGKSFSYAEGKFTVNVAAPAPTNTAPTVKVTGVTDKSQHEYGSVPKAQCSVVDKEDGNKTFDATISAISGPLASYGLGNQTASCDYTDAGGLKASAAATYEIVDTTAPVIKDAGTKQSANANGWYNADVTNDFTASDNVALADTSQASFSKTTTGESATVTVSSGTVKDVVGNEAVAVDSQGFKIDKTAPSITVGSPTSQPNAAGWYSSAVTNGFSASDALSGLANSAQASFSKSSGASEEGSAITIGSGTVADKAGNVADAKIAGPFQIDMTAPVIDNNGPTTQPNTNGWYKADVTNNFSASDALSGLANAADANISKTTQDEGSAVKVASGAVADKAGNVASSIDSRGFNVDKTKPVIVATGTVNGTAGTNGWYTSAIGVEFKASDGLSGFSGQANPYTFTASSETQQGDAVAVNSGTVTDLAGNAADSVNSGPFKIDYTKPLLSPSVSPNPVLLNGTATASHGTTDAHSDIASANCDSVITSSVGVKSVSCSAMDKAGNQHSASASYNVNYDFAGFFRPVDNKDASGNYILNVAKAGSTIPVKFSLAGDQGLNIFVSGSPSSGAITCDTAATQDTIEETSTATTSGLKYDALAGQYVYNWKTESTFAGKCRQLVVKFQDGTVQRANFKFTK